MKDFVHLHLHSEYSLLDGASKLKDLFSTCYENSQYAVAITDHGNMFAVFKAIKEAVKFTDPNADVFSFLKEKRKFKVKPIIGCELYITDDIKVKKPKQKNNHLILLAKNLKGYKNLISIVSKSYVDGFYYKPRADFDILSQHSEGLICLSACLAGEIPSLLLAGEIEKAYEVAKRYKELYKENYYIELQNHNLENQIRVLPLLAKIAKDLGIKMVATNDVHYLRKDDNEVQKVLQCISFRTTIKDGKDRYFPTQEFYLKTGDEMYDLFKEFDGAIENTIKIADQCDCRFFSRGKLLPAYSCDDSAMLLREKTYKGLEKKYKVITDEIKNRAEYELDIIIKLGFADYYLVVWDFINFAENNDIPVGPGRGSGVGSIVAYAIGITKVDPLRYTLIFERFLNNERVSNPDFDIDFCVDKRDKVIEYVINKYGADNVAQIITFGTLASKAAIKDVARVYGIPFAQSNQLTDAMNGLNKKSIAEIVNSDVPDTNYFIQSYKSSNEIRHIIETAIKIENMPRQTGIHAAGVIISKEKISHFLPLYKATDDAIISTQFDMIECEEIGMLKMDFLGLRTLTDIKHAIDLIYKNRGEKIDVYNIEYNDKNVFQMLSKGDTHAVFQLESAGMKKFMKELKPESMEDIIAGISLYRPGPMEYIADYVENKNNPNLINYSHPLLKKILEVTYGIIVYQEQVMQIVRELGGYTYGRADIVRRMMSKKKSAEMEKEKNIFIFGLHDSNFDIDGAISRGVPHEVASDIFDKMVSFAKYAFNKSHAAAYAFITYQTAFLKHYYFIEYICAVLNNRISNLDEISNYLNFALEKGYTVLSPDINKSSVGFQPEDNKIRVGLGGIKNVGIAIIESIISEREKNGKFDNMYDFINRLKKENINKKMLESLILAGAFDCFNETRATLMRSYPSILNRIMHDKKLEGSMQMSLFDEINDDISISYEVVQEFPLNEKLKYEKEIMGVYISAHPLDSYRNELQKNIYNTKLFLDDNDFYSLINKNISIGGILYDCKMKYSKNNVEYGFGKIEDLYGSVELFLPPQFVLDNKSLFEDDNIVTISGKVAERNGLRNFIIEKIRLLQNQDIAVSNQKMYILVSFSKEEEKLNKVKEIINSSMEGNIKVLIRDVDTNKPYSFGTVKLSKALLRELKGALGDETKLKII